MKFLDQAQIHIRSGNGGNGCLSFRREKFVEFGGPDGGNGGQGGDVVARAISNLNTLIDFRYRQHVKASNGGSGKGKNMTGGRGADAVMKVPVGTQIRSEDGVLFADLVHEGDESVLLRGGRGGVGNAHFKSSTNRAPRRTEPGDPGKEVTIVLRLKLLADAGLVGLPNAGKSTFLAAVSRAHPKIAAYPFTTLYPQLGVVLVGDGEFVLADIPGLIEGAHEGHGLGDRFLGHVERCGVLLHLIDGTGEDVAGAYRTVRQELASYGAGLAEKLEIVGLNKCDAIDADTIEIKKSELEVVAEGPVFALSGAAKHGVDTVVRRLGEMVNTHRIEAGHSEQYHGSERPWTRQGKLL